MENLKSYENFLNEEEGISFIIFSDLKEYFETDKSPNYIKAKAYVKKKNKKWNLSKEDYQEAVKKFKK